MEPHGNRGDLEFSVDKLLSEDPKYFVFNGAEGTLKKHHPLKAKVGETIRIFFGVGGPNYTSSFHVIGEIMDRVYEQASLTSAPLTDVQTTMVPLWWRHHSGTEAGCSQQLLTGRSCPGAARERLSRHPHG